MVIINLRDLYPWYTKDEPVEISDVAASVIIKDLLREEAYQRKVHRYKANYALDWLNEADIVADDKNKSPLDRYIENLDKQLLYSAIAELSDIQAKRLYAYFFLDMNTNDIARAEGVSKQSVSVSLSRAAKKLRDSLKNVNLNNSKQNKK